MKEVVQNEYCRLMQILNIAADIGEPRRRPVVPIATIIRVLLRVPLAGTRSMLRLGILDGTCMGGYWYTIHAVAEEFADFPVRVLRVSEHYSASQTSRTAQRTFWVATTDMSLSPEAAREAAHLQWTIENGDFRDSGLYRSIR